MNCEEYKEAITADPSFDDAGAHLSRCADCRQYRAQMEMLDQKIGQALDIRVPDLEMPDLPAVDTRGVVSLAGRRRSTPAWFALAASVLVAAVIGVRMLGEDIAYDSLAEEIVAHLDHEPYALRVADTPVSARRLRSVVPENVASMDHSVGLITYAQTCVINGREVPHLVIQGQRGPVTVLLLPDERISAAIPLAGEHIDGFILPVGKGSVAIIGERDEALEVIRERVVNSVAWDI